MEESFEISETTVVTVMGELDLATAPQLRERLEEAIHRTSSEVVVADLLGVSFIDSTALGVLVTALKQSQDEGREFRIALADDRILKILEITGLKDVFAISPSLADAVG